jgi:hypothetical protein
MTPQIYTDLHRSTKANSAPFENHGGKLMACLDEKEMRKPSPNL